MKKWLFRGSLILLLCSCQSYESQQSIEPLILGEATPVNLGQLETEIILSDYVLDIDRIDSITTDGPFAVTHKDSMLVLSGEPTQALHNLNLWSGGIAESILLAKTEKMKVGFRYEGESGQSVKIKGAFNAWNPNATILTELEAVFTTEAILAPGRYEYLYVIDGQEQTDPSNPDSISNGMGGWNSVLSISGPNVAEVPRVVTSSYTEEVIACFSAQELEGVYVYWQNRFLTDKSVEISDGNIKISIPQEAEEVKRSKVRLWAFNDEGVSNDVLIPLEYGRVLDDPSNLARQDWEAMVMYFLMVDRFSNGDPDNDRPLNIPEVHPKADYFGGDLIGVTEKIKEGYFTDLGVNTIWLSPITQNPEGAYGKYPEPETSFSGYHGYWPISNVRVDYRFGTSGDFQTLVDLAHQSEMNVLLDYVANHVHEEHPIYQENPDWATDLHLPDGTLNTQLWDEQRLTTWFDTFMPTLDLSRIEIVDPMTDSAVFWLERYGIDGFRHDATKHIPEIFWRVLTRKIKERVVSQAGEPVFQIGETYGSHELIKSYIKSGLLDAQFDFNMYDRAVSAFAGAGSMEELARSLKESLKYYGDHNLMGYITGNQDRARFISYADGSLSFAEDAKYAGWNRKIAMQDTIAYRKLSALTAYMMAIPGIPCIYYGDEYGSVGGNDPDNRKQMLFDGLDKHQLATRNRAKKLIQIRKNSLALTYGDTDILSATRNALVLSRSYFDSKVIAVFNTSNEELVAEIPAGGKANFYGIVDDDIVKLPPFGFDLITYN